jgi:hypothetical protein
MCGIQPIGVLDAKIQLGFDLQRLIIGPVPKHLPLQQFHVWPATGAESSVCERANQ